MRIVFLCVENSNRSQMAEAWGHIYAPADWEIYSAGSKPSGKVNPKAVEAMKELGYDMGPHRSKGLPDLPTSEFDVAITMGCGDNCPTLKAAQRIDWQIPDPKLLTPEEYREIRNLIGRMVQSLVAEVSAK